MTRENSMGSKTQKTSPVLDQLISGCSGFGSSGVGCFMFFTIMKSFGTNAAWVLPVFWSIDWLADILSSAPALPMILA